MAEASVRDRLRDVIASTNDEDDEVRGGVLKSWVVIASWVGVDGNPWLTTAHDEDSPSWERIGMLQTTLDTARQLAVESGTEEED